MAAPSIQVNGLGQLSATLQALPGAVAAERKKANAEGARQIQKFWQIQLSGPAGPRRLGVRTGKSRQSIRIQRRGSEGWIIGTHLKHLSIHEFGGKTPPHEIRPRVAKALRFKAGGSRRAETTLGGVFVFAKKVNHPGSNIPKRPHRAPAVKSVWPVIQLLFDGKKDEAMRKSLAIGRRLERAQKARFAQAERRGLTGRRR